MKKLKLTAMLAGMGFLAGCAGPLGIQRPWPDGASVHVGEFTIQASMSGAGSVVMRDVSWVGTNGFPAPDGTNLVVVTPPVTVVTPGAPTAQLSQPASRAPSRTAPPRTAPPYHQLDKH